MKREKELREELDAVLAKQRHARRNRRAGAVDRPVRVSLPAFYGPAGDRNETEGRLQQLAAPRTGKACQAEDVPANMMRDLLGTVHDEQAELLAGTVMALGAGGASRRIDAVVSALLLLRNGWTPVSSS